MKVIHAAAFHRQGWHIAALPFLRGENMIDPNDMSVATIEYLFAQQIMKLTAAACGRGDRQ